MQTFLIFLIVYLLLGLALNVYLVRVRLRAGRDIFNTVYAETSRPRLEGVAYLVVTVLIWPVAVYVMLTDPTTRRRP